MKYRVLELLQPPCDGKQLRVTATKVKKVPFEAQLTEVRCKQFCGLKNCPVKEANLTAQDCNQCYSQEILEGELTSDSGKRYPIRDGIPRLLSDQAADFVRKNRASFSLEWKYFQFGERNWGQDIAFRKGLFLKAFGVTPAELRGRLIFDAGCGSGLLSIEMANSFGLEVVGLDLATGIEKAYARNTNPFVHFIQGSVLEPPLKDRAVDYVYCAGVLVALPDTRQGFEALPRCLKTGGRCVVWLYHPFEKHRQTHDYGKEILYDWIRANVTSRLPIKMQEMVYLAMIPPFLIKRSFGNLFRKAKDTRTWREKMQGFVDHFSPMYMNRHSEAEATQWFKENEFGEVTVSYTEQYGFAIRGDRLDRRVSNPVLDK